MLVMSDSHHDIPKMISRRKLLASLGMAGAAAVMYGSTLGVVNGKGSVTEAVYDKDKEKDEDKDKGKRKLSQLSAMDYCIPVTIAGLRAMTKLDADLIYFVTDPGQEGDFRYDPSDTVSVDNTGLVLVSVSGGRFKRIVTGDHYSVKWFGAKGDGLQDDMDFIQSAIDAVYTKGGGTVFFPKGTYIVSPSLQTRRIVPKDNVNLLGEGASSVIKVKEDAGDYWTIIGNFQTWPKVRNVSIRGLRFDQNPQGNRTCNIDPNRNDTFYWTQYCIGLFDYENILVEDCMFDPICGWNTVVLNNPSSSHAAVNNCSFNFVHTKGVDGYDNSAVYLNGRYHTVTNNRFFAASDEKAMGAIETHTGQSVVSGNISDGYVTGVHIQSSDKSGDHSDITVTGNTFTNAVHAIQFWPYKEFALKNVTVTGNTISLNNAKAKRNMMVGIGAYPGGLPVTFTGSFENITISGNTIHCEEEFTKRDNLLEGFCYGIGFVRETDVKNIVISNNIIKNAPITAIHIGNTRKVGTMSNIQIIGNIIVNAAHYPSANEAYKAAILLRSTVVGVKIAGNMITDTYDTALCLYSIRLNTADGTFTDVEVTDNLITSKQGGLWLDLSSTVRTDAPDKFMKFSDRYFDDPALESGTTYQPGALVIVTNGSLTPGKTPVGYKILNGGTFGALVGVTATGKVGTSKVTVNDASKLKVGQWIRIQTGNQLRRINRIAGTELRVNAALATDVPLASAVTYSPPVYEPFGQVGRLPAIGDTTGSTLEQLEAEMNRLKQAMRDFGIVSV